MLSLMYYKKILRESDCSDDVSSTISSLPWEDESSVDTSKAGDEHKNRCSDRKPSNNEDRQRTASKTKSESVNVVTGEHMKQKVTTK